MTRNVTSLKSVGAEITTYDPKAHNFLQKQLFLGAHSNAIGGGFVVVVAVFNVHVTVLPKMLDFSSVEVGSIF